MGKKFEVFAWRSERFSSERFFIQQVKMILRKFNQVRLKCLSGVSHQNFLSLDLALKA